jgi:peptide/nickel transport system permease protein
MAEPEFQSRAWRRFRRSRSAWIGGLLVGLCMFGALAADLLAPYGPTDRGAKTFLRPSAEHFLGTDSHEYDVFTRTLYGARLSLLASVVSVGIAITIGGFSGAVAGYFGGWTDSLILRSIDILLAFPGILIALLVVVALEPSWTAVILAVGVLNVPVFCRQVRATVLTVRDLDYVTACRALGATPGYTLRRAILPSLVNPIIVLATLGLGTAILEVAGLSFLGIAGQPDEPEWGNMLAEAKNHLATTFYPALAPGVAISLAVLGFNLLGDGLRDALDPRLHGRDE